jgi:hypothetical protein
VRSPYHAAVWCSSQFIAVNTWQTFQFNIVTLYVIPLAVSEDILRFSFAFTTMVAGRCGRKENFAIVVVTHFNKQIEYVMCFSQVFFVNNVLLRSVALGIDFL